MQILRTRHTLHWGEMDVPLFGAGRDWFGKPVDPPPGWCLVEDTEALWIIASRESGPDLMPGSSAGRFIEGLWHHDVVELFIAHPQRRRYLEINLAPNGAHWACLFDAPRQRSSYQPDFPFETHADLSRPGSWVAAMSLPLDFLRKELDFSDSSPANLTFMLGSATPRHLSVAGLPGAEPDFHQPAAFPIPHRIDVDVPAAP